MCIKFNLDIWSRARVVGEKKCGRAILWGQSGAAERDKLYVCLLCKWQGRREIEEEERAWIYLIDGIAFRHNTWLNVFFGSWTWGTQWRINNFVILLAKNSGVPHSYSTWNRTLNGTQIIWFFIFGYSSIPQRIMMGMRYKWVEWGGRLG